MASEIEYTGIDNTFPVAGQDNNSQGFRDNFSNIRNALSVAKTEISNLQDKAVLTGVLGTEATISNDLNGSSIENGSYLKFYGKSSEVISNGELLEITPTNGDYQIVKLSSDVTLKFIEFPEAGLYCKLRLQLTPTDSSATYVVDFSTSGIIRKDEFLNNDANVAFMDIKRVIDVWTSDGGDTVFVSHVGDF